MIIFNWKSLSLSLFVFFFYSPFLLAEQQATSYTFFHLETLFHKGVVQKEKIANGEFIEIRGFLYKTEDSGFILAAEPNLRTCCVGSPIRAYKQLCILGNINSTMSQNYAITLRGNLIINFEKDFPFQLENAMVINEKKQSLHMVLIGSIVAFVCSSAFIWKKRRRFIFMFA